MGTAVTGAITATATRGAADRSLIVAGVDEHAASRLRAACRVAGWELLATRGAPDAAHHSATSNPVAIVLAVGDSTPAELQRLARQRPDVPVLVWASAATSDAVATLLLAGAADVLGSRMGDLELHARISRAHGARSGSANAVEVAQTGELQVDTFRGEATWRGRPLTLTNRERDVLDVLVREQGRTLRRQVIYQRVWGHAMPTGDRNVDVNVKRLREKLARGTDGEVTVETVSRVGYRLRTPESASTARDDEASDATHDRH